MLKIEVPAVRLFGMRRATWWPALAGLWPLGVLAALAVLCFARLFLPEPLGREVVVRGDFTDEFYAIHQYTYRALQRGRLPLWNSETYAGYPFLGEPQSAVFYPPHLLMYGVLMLLGETRFPILALESMLPLHVFLAASFTYALARAEGLERWPSLLAGVGFGLGGYLLSYPVQQLPVLEAVTWLPALLFALARVAESQDVKTAVRWGVVAGWAFGLALLAGHSQSVLFLGYSAAAYLAARAALRWRGGELSPGRAVLLVAAGLAGSVLLGFLLAGVQFVPAYELFQLSTRKTISYADAANGFPLPDLVSLFRPTAYFTRALFVGPLFLALTLLAVGWARRRALTLFWATASLFALALSLGGNGPLYAVLYQLAPGFDIFRNQERAIVVTSLGVALLAAHGLELVVTRRPAHLPRRGVAAALGVAAVAALALLVVRWAPPAEGARPALLVAMAGLAVLAATWAARLSPRLAAPLLISLAALSLVRLNWVGNFAPVEKVSIYPSTSIVRYLQERGGPHRVATDHLWPPNHGYVYGLQEVSGISEMRVKTYYELRQALRRERFLQLLGVRYIVSWKRDLAEEPAWQGRLRLLETEESSPFTGDPLYLYEVVDSPALASSIRSLRAAEEAAEALAILADPQLDVRSAAVRVGSVEGVAPGVLGGQAVRDLAEARVQIGYWKGERVELQADAPGPAYLLIRQTAYPGWRARVNGVEWPLDRVDHGLQGLSLDPGRHSIVLEYSPESFGIGLAGSIVGLIVSGLLLAYAALPSTIACSQDSGTDEPLAPRCQTPGAGLGWPGSMLQISERTARGAAKAPKRT